VKILKVSEIIKPTRPSARIPIAETLATVENSYLEGFLRMCQTLIDCVINDLSF